MHYGNKVQVAHVLWKQGSSRLVWPSILLLFVELWRHLADSNEPNFIHKNVFKFNWVTGSPPKFDALLASWYPTRHTCKVCAEQNGDMYSEGHKKHYIFKNLNGLLGHHQNLTRWQNILQITGFNVQVCQTSTYSNL